MKLSEVIALDSVRFDLPLAEEDWYAVASDDVACSSEEEDNAKVVANLFFRATKTPSTSNNSTSSVKRVGPEQRGQGLVELHGVLYLHIL